MEYSIDEHKHRFAAWAAGRAASVIGCRFPVEEGKAILEKAEMNRLICSPDNLAVRARVVVMDDRRRRR